ncbi:hypothetical protein [Actinomadura kijaniata]|uniref:hypothetical protein n=1 Tax=Actinomadura kijaniata TaxID=46161 RepID=UPI0008320440|nr:hypothetical protein [Actinomadura kijaniata]
MTGQLTSPLSTGGAGVVFEYRVAALMFSRLLRGAHVPVGIQLPLERVALQQRNEGYPFDDIVAHAGPDGDGPSIQIQVKRRLQITRRDAEFIKVMTTALDVCRTHPDELDDGSLLMGLAAGAPTSELSELAELTEMARAHTDHHGLQSLLRAGITHQRLRTRYDHVNATVATAAGGVDDQAAAPLTHRLLASLHVWQVLTGPDDRDWQTELDGLAPLAARAGRTSADIMEHLCGFAQEHGPRSGHVDADLLRRELRGRYGIRLASLEGTVQRSGASITVSNTGPGTVFAGERQEFHNLRIGS